MYIAGLHKTTILLIFHRTVVWRIGRIGASFMPLTGILIIIIFLIFFKYPR